jgi:hypothetical protein
MLTSTLHLKLRQFYILICMKNYFTISFNFGSFEKIMAFFIVEMFFLSMSGLNFAQPVDKIIDIQRRGYHQKHIKFLRDYPVYHVEVNK